MFHDATVKDQKAVGKFSIMFHSAPRNDLFASGDAPNG